MKFEDRGYSSENVDWKDTIGDMTIIVQITPEISHEYAMRKSWEVSHTLPIFKHWHQLMKDENYVCLAGRFINREKFVDRGEQVEVYNWMFDKIKTQKGCASYFDGDCDRTYEQWLKENNR